MKNKRMKELLDSLIDNEVLAGRKLSDGIERLLKVGFTPEELINDFNFTETDLRLVLEEYEQNEY